MYIRVLSIRKHKIVSFINAYSDEWGTVQFKLKNEILTDFKCGDLLNVDYIESKNMKGEDIKEITKINFVISNDNFESYKGINSDITDIKLRDYLNARNCGTQLLVLKFKQELLKKIRQILDNLDFFDATNLLNSVEFYKNGSGIIDAEIKDREDKEPKFLRVTLENQLKQMVGTLLKSCYSIDKVYRNMGEDSGHINEFLMLEFVSVSLKLEEIINFVQKIDDLSRIVSEKYNLEVLDLQKIEIVDYRELMKNNFSFEQLKKDLNNFLIINYPCNSPFIKSNEIINEKQEIRWYMRGHWISHFYKDENNYEIIKNAIKDQNAISGKDETNPLDYFSWGLPNTTSFGLSIDRWLQMLLNKENINSIANPIGIDYINMKRNLKK